MRRDRGHRRRATRRVAKRRRALHLAAAHADQDDVDCVCELADTYFAKRPALGCTCRKRVHGNPRVSRGVCGYGSRDRVYECRRETRELKFLVLAGADPQGDSVNALSRRLGLR